MVKVLCAKEDRVLLDRSARSRREPKGTGDRTCAGGAESLQRPLGRALGALRLGLHDAGAWPRLLRWNLGVFLVYLAFLAGFFSRYLEGGLWVIDYSRFPEDARFFTSALGGVGLALAVLCGIVAGGTWGRRQQ